MSKITTNNPSEKYLILDDLVVPDETLQSWQQTIDLLAEIVDVPAALITRVHPCELEVFLASQSSGNIYSKGDKALLNTGHYCETVITTRMEVLVANSSKDPEWKNAPETEHGMISYYGLPLMWPTGEIFGTICILDNTENHYSEQYCKLIEQFQQMIELNLRSIHHEQNRKQNTYPDVGNTIKKKEMVEALRRSEVLGLLATDASIDEVLIALIESSEKHNPEILCSVLLLDEDGKYLRYAAAPSLPDFYNKAMDPLEVRLDTGACGQAAYTGKMVIVENIMTHPECKPFRQFTSKAGLMACWVQPIISSTGNVLGTFAVYFREPRAPEQNDLDYIEDSARLAAIAIERKQAELALQESQTNLKHAQRVAHVGSWELDISNNSLKWSDETYRIFAIPNTEVITFSKFIEYVHPDDRVYINEAWEMALNKHEYEEEHRIIVNDEIKWINSKSYFECDKEGHPVKVRGTIQDITERKQIEAKARQHLEEVAHYSRISTIGEMTSEIAHELNQPLTSIASYGDALSGMLQSDNWDMGDILDSLQDITQQALRAGEVIRRLRNFVRKNNTYKDRFNANAIIDGVLKLISVQARWHDIEIIAELSDSLPEIKVDKILFEQVLINLIHNAIEAMSCDEIVERRSIIRSMLNDNGEVQIEICDTGPGIDDEQIAKIFEPFHTTKPSGMGMGLSICRSIIEDNDGKLRVDSQPGQGACFRLTIPVANERESSSAN